MFEWIMSHNTRTTIFDTARVCAEKGRWSLLVNSLDVYDKIPSVTNNPWARENYELKLKVLMPYRGRSPLVDAAIENLQAALEE